MTLKQVTFRKAPVPTFFCTLTRVSCTNNNFHFERINPFFKRSSSNPEPEDLKSSTSNGGGSDEGSKKKAAAEPSPVKPSFGKAKDMKVSKFVNGPSEEECYFTDHPSR